MTIIIEKNLSKEKVKNILLKLKKDIPEIGLKKHFGKSKEKTDAVKFQKEVRNEWN